MKPKGWYAEAEYERVKGQIQELELEHQSLCADHEALLAEYREHRDRADRLVVIADALAEEIGRLERLVDVVADDSRRDAGMLLTAMSDATEEKHRADRTRAALRELYQAVEAARPYEDGEAVDVPDEAWERIDAALKAEEEYADTSLYDLAFDVDYYVREVKARKAN